MNAEECRRLALRIDELLRPELGVGVDADRMVTDPLYARDALLVCDAMSGGELPVLARQFRAAAVAAAAAAHAAQLPVLQPASQPRTGFSVPGLLGAVFGRGSAGRGAVRAE